jgi:hypothetical protein
MANSSVGAAFLHAVKTARNSAMWKTVVSFSGTFGRFSRRIFGSTSYSSSEAQRKKVINPLCESRTLRPSRGRP